MNSLFELNMASKFPNTKISKSIFRKKKILFLNQEAPAKKQEIKSLKEKKQSVSTRNKNKIFRKQTTDELKILPHPQTSLFNALATFNQDAQPPDNKQADGIQTNCNSLISSSIMDSMAFNFNTSSKNSPVVRRHKTIYIQSTPEDNRDPHFDG